MELYVTVSFWIGVVGFALRGLTMCVTKYPRNVEYSVGMDSFILIVSMGFLIWAAYLLYS
jgi:hypothetical protein